MSAGFSSLYYTDCLPGQGLRGGAGFQFQSVSAGVGHEEMTLVQRSSLYEAPVAWMREQRAVADYPPSLTHVFDGRFATARGIYLGAEANGVREGNQFTHAVTTDDPDAYGQVRPAQLWDAPWWVEEPAPSTKCDPVPAEPEHGPWGRDAVREWVLGKPGAQDWLTAVLSALDRIGETGGKRIAFVATDASDVLGWLTAGTLLLPQARALRISFRVFATNPQYSRHDVIALHPDWAGQYADARRDHEYIVFNLVTGEHSEIEPTDAARHWVPRFLRHDPYDVVDAVEWADQCARLRGEPANAGDWIASAVVTLDEPADSAEAGEQLAKWIASQPEESVDDYRVELVEAALGCARSATGLRFLDIGAHRLEVPEELACRVRCALLVAEVAELVSGTSEERPERALPPGRWDGSRKQAMAEIVEQAADLVRPELMDSLLRLSSRFRVEPRIGAFRDGAHRFVTWWADHPAAPVDPDGWPNTDDMLYQLRDALHVRLVRHQECRAEIRSQWWRRLWPTISDPSTPLDAELASAAVEQGGLAVRADIVNRVLDRSPHDEVVWRALFGYAAPTTSELLLIISRLGRISASVADKVFDVIDRSAPRALGREQLDVLAALAKRGRTPRSGRLRRASEEDTALRSWLDSPSARSASSLDRVSLATLDIRAQQVTYVLLEKLPCAEAVKVVERSGQGLPVVLSGHLPGRWGTWSPNSARAVALAYVTAGGDNCPDLQSGLLEKRLREFVRRASSEQLRDVSSSLAEAGRDYAEDWRAFAAKAKEKSEHKPAKAQAPKQQAEEDAAKAPRAPRWRFGRRGEE